VFSKEALGQCPVLWQLAGLFHHRVYPGYPSGDFLVFDTVAGVGVLFHYFPGAGSADGVDLEEYGGSGAGHAYAVLFYETVYCAGAEDCPRKVTRPLSMSWRTLRRTMLSGRVHSFVAAGLAGRTSLVAVSCLRSFPVVIPVWSW
jgi:hypothetical protein